MWFKSHPRNHSKAARPIGRAVFAFSGAEAGLGSTYTGETKGGARSASLSQADERLPAQFPCPRPKRRGFTGGTWFRPSDRARPALRCRNGVSAETPAIRREPLCAATEAVKCKGAPAKPVLRGRQIPSPQPFKNSSSNWTGCFCVFWCGSGACLPCVRGGAERMRSGGVVGMVQEKADCNRQPVPIRYPQPLSRLRRQLPLHRGAKPRGDGRPGVCPFSPGQKKTAVGRQRCGRRSALFPQQRPRSGAGLLSARPAGLGSAPANAAAAALAAPAAAAAGASALFHGAQGQRGPQGQKPQDHSRSHGAQSRPASWNTPQAQSQATAHCSRETPAAFQPESSSRRTAAMAAMQGV